MKCTRNLQCRRPQSDDYNLQHDRPEMFVVAQFGPPYVAIIWHGVWSSYFTVTLLVEILVFDKSEIEPTWLITSQNWGYLLVIFASFVEFLSRLATLLVRKDIVKGDCRSMTWHLKVQWVFLNTNNVISILLTGLYSIVVTPELSFDCLNRIISPSLYVVLTNTVINIQPVKFFHFYQPAVFAVVFVIISSAIPRSSINVPSETFVFRRDKPVETGLLSVCIIVIVIPLMHLLFYLIFKLRIFTCNKQFDKNSGSKCPLQAAIQRDITATDVVLEDNARVTYIELKPDTQDDITVHFGAKENSKYAKTNDDRRINKSETDLHEYRSRNGLYCDFAPTPGIFHHTPELEETESAECPNRRASADTSTGSQIILVKACNGHVHGHVNEAFDEESDCSEDDVQSNASSDFLSEYINQERLPYM